MDHSLKNIAIGDPVEVKVANRDLGDIWKPATVVLVEHHAISVAFADGQRYTIARDIRRIRPARKPDAVKTTAFVTAAQYPIVSSKLSISDEDLALFICGALHDECERGQSGFVDDTSRLTAVRVDGHFDLVDLARRVRMRMGIA